MPRPRLGFALIDLPSDHEIEGGLVTECQVIATMLHNRDMGGVLKHFRATTRHSFKNNIRGSYKGLGFVHLSTHGAKDGISLIGGTVSWRSVADVLKQAAPSLQRSQQRVLNLSCCYSQYGYDAMRHSLKGHFTGAYFFEKNRIAFVDAMTAWAMFYRRRVVERPAKAIVSDINTFFGRDVICYDAI